MSNYDKNTENILRRPYEALSARQS